MAFDEAGCLAPTGLGIRLHAEIGGGVSQIGAILSSALALRTGSAKDIGVAFQTDILRFTSFLSE
ncbi:MAG: hypothetical protein HYZ11_16350 [Candidatus Tectomicrobia bacterium]|uniref:Uncharacterized protein n=1 Tax=Tectimicrobiota bacterium TaxID=2528274 RepID=A0A932I0L2_UNCTE|nr:hypothetical protein [Candidatus Tectomicrobia bacterium]